LFKIIKAPVKVDTERDPFRGWRANKICTRIFNYGIPYYLQWQKINKDQSLGCNVIRLEGHS
jgi:hypothetical protein